MRLLRNTANISTLKTVYYALCQSLLTYCNSCWGSAAKSVIIQVERAQRAVLKAMLKRPFRYPTFNLHQEASILTVRQLFILKVTLEKHKNIVVSDLYAQLLEKRVYRIPTPSARTYVFRYKI